MRAFEYWSVRLDKAEGNWKPPKSTVAKRVMPAKTKSAKQSKKSRRSR